MPSYDCDVAVIGAGPAGSRTARDLARRGLRVLLIEEHRRVGVPSHCSGLISPRTWQLGEIADDSIIYNQLRGAFLHTASGKQVALGSETVRAVAIDRIKWDQLLAEQAYAAGAQPVQARFIHAERDNGGFTLHCQRNGQELGFTARLLIGADGSHSRVARSQGLAWPSDRVYALGVEGSLEVPREDYVHVFVGQKLAPGWFGWIIPVGGGQVRAGIGCYGWDKPLHCYQRMLGAFPQVFAGIKPSRMYGGPIPTSFAPRSFADSLLLVGDAAGQVKPFSGGGIYTSLVAARLCAETAAAALERNDLSASFLSRYEKAWMRAIGRELRRSLGIRRFGLSLSDADVDRLVGLLRSPRLQAIAARHGDIDYPSRSLLRISRALPALGPLLGISARRPLLSLQLLRAALFG
ncbi:MAG TPA: NAD(P)/FAD-dependent oxidoreductase [Dehalococcoidia bacterium]|nr:NAD(P)/FAD-dependent oxidoreductase [Dehalococcoidia bacterium]